MYEPTDVTRIAIECLTLWMESGDSARLKAAEHIADLTHDRDGPGPDKIIVGLLNLSMFLVYRLAKAEGATTATDIGQRGSEILRELSPKLPE